MFFSIHSVLLGRLDHVKDRSRRQSAPLLHLPFFFALIKYIHVYVMMLASALVASVFGLKQSMFFPYLVCVLRL